MIPTEKPEQYKNFERGLKQILSVPKEELDRRLKAEQEAKEKEEAQPASDKK